ncbi:uncharacterized protein LOC121431379 [Lytechinus variegatus]|uniref:uncharacterized protein LOC121431379 n=1 Tax=Lytechinus variegatus TaxID=7654 RepID=UPI001BB1725E|nr:uncharacterized protein LOC121431379 [Lytechinus variegatus]
MARNFEWGIRQSRMSESNVYSKNGAMNLNSGPRTVTGRTSDRFSFPDITAYERKEWKLQEVTVNISLVINSVHRTPFMPSGHREIIRAAILKNESVVDSEFYPILDAINYRLVDEYHITSESLARNSHCPGAGEELPLSWSRRGTPTALEQTRNSHCPGADEELPLPWSRRGTPTSLEQTRN